MNPSSISSLWELYKLAENSGFTTSALWLAFRLREANPEDSFWSYLYGKNLVLTGLSSEAVVVLKEAHRSSEDRFRFRIEFNLAQAYERLGQLEDAEYWFERSINSASGKTEPRIFFAGYLTRRERFSQACDVLEEATTCEGDLDEVFLNLGLNRRSLGNLLGAKQSFEFALQVSPDYELARRCLKDVELAIEIIKHMEETEGNNEVGDRKRDITGDRKRGTENGTSLGTGDGKRGDGKRDRDGKRDITD